MLRNAGPIDVNEKQIMELVNPRKVVDGRYVSENVEIDRILNTEEYRGSGCHYGVAFAADGRKFRVSMRTGQFTANPWTLMYEIKQFRQIINEEGRIDIKAVIRDFIVSQYRDGEEISAEYVEEDLKRSESASAIAGVKFRYAKFSEIYPKASKKIAEVTEEALIEIFCETESEPRMLVEEKGVFSWQSR